MHRVHTLALLFLFVTAGMAGTIFTAEAGAPAGPAAVTVAHGEVLAPGPGIASQETGSLTVLTGGRVALEIDSYSNRWDQVVVAGDLTLQAGAVLALTELGAIPLPNGKQLILISYTGTWNGIVFSDALGAPLSDGGSITLGGRNFVVDYDDTSGGVTPIHLLTLTSRPPLTPYQAWIAGYPLASPDDAPTADPDADGVPNLWEFAFNDNPASATPNPRRKGGISDSTPAGFLYLTTPVRNGVIFNGSIQLNSSPVDGLYYWVESSEDLVNWSLPLLEIPAAITNGLPPANPGWSYRTFRLSEPLAHPRPRAFLRMGVTGLP